MRMFIVQGGFSKMKESQRIFIIRVFGVIQVLMQNCTMVMNDFISFEEFQKRLLDGCLKLVIALLDWKAVFK